ncbi:hypothetical protein MESS2_1250038 [Mesorhizobium metallidurans STM 2683]|uniref:Spermatogenesis-associated protein 20-like TRX domain-containing protein n=1 Tax=Mesorhizobium metallidurans STM 2683 TaxID=1297569 RepID=M5EJL4_9HYPH|nr:hypothetical protein MESS2_1250038 [Mesorhizobium metallidurans STM 2683]
MPAQNLLAEEASPYLQQHSGNPVHWRGWSPAALAEARTLDRPILLSVGYAACHWCHVMAHESFENDDVAAVMNRLFVNIKVDREERPDIDQIYMAALSSMGEQGGWPLTMFLTPDGKPFWGGTYFPREARYGRPGFIQVMEAVDKAWRDKRPSLNQSADGLATHVERRLAGGHAKAALDRDTLENLANGIDGIIDRELGGLRGAPKFPNAPFMQTLWLSWLRDGATSHRDAVLTSLQKMLAGGIYDHVGGGLSRYSTDAEWLVPHFEKMLYDNAQSIRLCNWAYTASGNDLFRLRIEETIGWLLREMRADGGAFAASLDADSDGEEGLFYTWGRDEVEAVLGDESALFFNYFTLSSPHGWEGKPVLHQTAAQQVQSVADRDRLIPLKERLLAAREKRVRPGRDGKALTDWNGLMIAALAEAGRSFGRADWIEAAEIAFAHIANAAQNNRLPHSMLGAKKLFPALSSDYAAMTNAAIALFEATGDSQYVDRAGQFIEQLDHWHRDGEKNRLLSDRIGQHRRADPHQGRCRRSYSFGHRPDHRSLGPTVFRYRRSRTAGAGLENRRTRGRPRCPPDLWPGRHRQRLRVRARTAEAGDRRPPRESSSCSGCESKSGPAPGGYCCGNRYGSESADATRRHLAANRQARRLAVHGAGLFAGDYQPQGTRTVATAKIEFVILWRSKERSDAAQTIGSMP